MVAADVAIKSLVAIYAPNIVAERGFLFSSVGAVPERYKAASVNGDWNAILDPKIDKVGRRASRLGRCEDSLVGLMTRHGLVDRFRLDHPGREMWMWLCQSRFLLGQSVS